MKIQSIIYGNLFAQKLLLATYDNLLSANLSTLTKVIFFHFMGGEKKRYDSNNWKKNVLFLWKF